MPVRLVVIGDSFVEGRGDPAPHGSGYRGWLPTFAGLLGLRDDECRNHGEHLATTAAVLDRQLDAVRSARPRLAGMIAGFNDIVGEYRPAEFRANLTTIFDALTRHASLAFTATYPDVTRRMALAAPAGAEIRARIRDANAALRTVAAEFNLVCLDTARPGNGWDADELWSADGIHPNRAGHLRFAGEMADAVADSLGIALTATAPDPAPPLPALAFH
ncbi:GDSL-type esterase/lipase family protein [Frankia sp. AgB32]|uniref:SGNH/GDSL hydrolase family protein n=1 Tax=Frankia sp. AgB32 TaxID=631119 RepID=UPI00200F562C|nr:GDSL-type esterase/lipase family protein [Frankia sp. AgB32]MCK9897354.1 GDSL-type esterase/lipase family protein [Frankia sp. AgB32]